MDDAPLADGSPAAMLEEAHRQYAAGSFGAAARLALQAGEAAKRDGRPDQVAAAALIDDGLPDPATAAFTERLAREALEMIGLQPTIRARLLAQLSMALHHRECYAEAETAATAAMAVADAAGAPEAFVAAANARLLSMAGDDAGSGIRDLAQRMLEAAIGCGSETGELFARNWLIAGAMREADLAAVAHEVDSLDVLGARSGIGVLVRWNAALARAGLDHARGRFADSEASARAARVILPPTQRHQTEPLFVAQLMLLATDRGVAPAEMAMVRDVAVGAPIIRAAMTARYDLEMGDRVSAQATFDAVRPRLASVAIDRRGAPALMAGLELAVAFGDAATAAELHARLEPFAGWMVASALGAVGPVASFLARAETLLGRHDAAVAHADQAALLAARGGFGPWHARARLGLADALAARAAPGDLPRARHLARLVEAAAGHLAMNGLRAAATARISSLDPGRRLSRREREIARLIAGGSSNRVIAELLGLSERTIETHVQHILTKLDLHARTQVAAWVVGADTEADSA